MIDVQIEHDGKTFGVLRNGFCCIQGPLARLSLIYAAKDEEENVEEPRGEEMASINGGSDFMGL